MRDVTCGLKLLVADSAKGRLMRTAIRCESELIASIISALSAAIVERSTSSPSTNATPSSCVMERGLASVGAFRIVT